MPLANEVSAAMSLANCGAVLTLYGALFGAPSIQPNTEELLFALISFAIIFQLPSRLFSLMGNINDEPMLVLQSLEVQHVISQQDQLSNNLSSVSSTLVPLYLRHSHKYSHICCLSNWPRPCSLLSGMLSLLSSSFLNS